MKSFYYFVGVKWFDASFSGVDMFFFKYILECNLFEKTLMRTVQIFGSPSSSKIKVVFELPFSPWLYQSKIIPVRNNLVLYKRYLAGVDRKGRRDIIIYLTVKKDFELMDE